MHAARPASAVCLVTVCAVSLAPTCATDAAEEGKAYLQARPGEIARWRDMKFGMFVCWGPVTLTGQEIGWSRGGERRGRGGMGKTPVEVYDNLYKKWKPEKFDARQWVRVASDAGARYMIFLVKHHDGFCLHDTKLTDYKSTSPEAAWRRDVMADVAAACHEAGLKLFVYYSQPDWHHPDYRTDTHARYVRYLHGQIRELLTHYGRIDGLWFDGLGGKAADWNAEELFRMARGIQPHVIINNRCGLKGDFDTPEQRIGYFQTDRPWESCITLGTQWSWKPNDRIKSLKECIHVLVTCATGDGSLALNTNPMPDGRIEPRQAERFRQIGAWLKRYGISIYGTRGGPFVAPDEKTRRQKGHRAHVALPAGGWWGGSTCRGKVAYLHILRWPSDTIVIPPIGRTLLASSVLTGGKALVRQTDEGIHVAVPADQRDPLDTIVRLEFDRPLAGLRPVVAEPMPTVLVTEKRLGNGSSEIRVTDRRGAPKATYTIKLLPHHHPTADPNDPAIKKWASWKLGAFVCYNSNQFTGNEICTTRDPKTYAPPVVDVKQWIETFKAAGMTYAVITARHTSGFLLWDSATTEFDVASSGNRTDVIRTFVEACRRQGMHPCIYYCLWGGKKCGVTGGREIPRARAVILAQLHELATRHGPIPYFWIDMKNWAPEDPSTQEIYDSLKNVNSETVVLFNQHIQDGSEIRYFPTDALDGEMTLPPSSGHKPARTVGGKTYYLPFEMNMTSQSWPRGALGGMYAGYSWFTYGSGKGFVPSKPLPPAVLYRFVRCGYERGACNVLLACAPDHTGRIRDEDVKQLLELGRILKDPSSAPPLPITFGCKASASGVWPRPRLGAALAFDGIGSTRWGGAPNTKSGWLAVDLGEPKTFSRLRVSEAFDRVRRFELQVKKNDSWQTVLRGTTLGQHFSASFEPVTARCVRLSILEATDVPTIWEVQLLRPGER